MADAQFTYRPRSGPIAAIAVWALAVWALVSLAITSPGRLAPWLVTGAWASLTVWAVFWAPKVVVSVEGLSIRNPTATYDVPWAAIARIDTKWALALYTANQKITAFAAPAPSGLRAASVSKGGFGHLPESAYGADRSIRPGDLPGTSSGDLAWVVRERWQKARQAGPTGAASGLKAVRRWHSWLLVTWAVLTAAAAAVQVLA